MYDDFFPAAISVGLIATTFLWAFVSDVNNLRRIHPVSEPAPEAEVLDEGYETGSAEVA